MGLARAIDLEVAHGAVVTVSAPKPSTLLGKGKVEEFAGIIASEEIALAVINHALSPVQQRNLEKAWNCKVIDRTALILEIFGARARTSEGKMQVELAALEYQKSRLVRSWTHLERQRGGFGFLGGPGESQIEVDRRLIRNRIARLKRELAHVTRTRELHRKVRRDVPYPLVALVGYTNAGKSTLFNRLTGAKVMSMDKLFATLDPTLRQVRLPSGARVILSDTVGFVSDLPHELVAAFRATLEEVLEADILVHVRDIAHPDTLAQKQDVEDVLRQLFKTDGLPASLIELCNKSDKLSHDERTSLEAQGYLLCSAATGDGVAALLRALDETVSKLFFHKARFTLSISDGRSLAWLHAHGKVLAEEVEGDYIRVDVELSEENLRRFEKRH